MAKADINITLSSDEDSFGMPLCRPGGMLRGTVIIYPDSDVNCKQMTARLIWHTEGRGTRYRQVVEEKDLFQGTLRMSMPRTFDFEFMLPDDPWSYEGHYVSVVWAIEVQIDVPWARDVKNTANFILAPVRPETSDW